MAGVKREWLATLKGVGRMFQHIYTGNILTGGSYVVTFVVGLERDPDRRVRVLMTSQEARDLADKLNQYADACEHDNRNAGYDG